MHLFSVNACPRRPCRWLLFFPYRGPGGRTFPCRSSIGAVVTVSIDRNDERNPVCCSSCRNAKVSRRNFSELLGKPHISRQMLHYFEQGADCWHRGSYDAAVVAFRSCLEAMVKGLVGVDDDRVSLLEALEMGGKMGVIDRGLRKDVLAIKTFGDRGAHPKDCPATYEDASEALRISSMHMNAALSPSPGMLAMMGLGGEVGDHLTWLTMPRCSVCGVR